MQQRLRAEAKPDDGESQDGDGHGGCAGDDERPCPAAEEGGDDEKPFTSPVVGRLRDYGAEDHGENGDGGGEPD